MTDVIQTSYLGACAPDKFRGLMGSVVGEATESLLYAVLGGASPALFELEKWPSALAHLTDRPYHGSAHCVGVHAAFDAHATPLQRRWYDRAARLFAGYHDVVQLSAGTAPPMSSEHLSMRVFRERYGPGTLSDGDVCEAIFASGLHDRYMPYLGEFARLMLDCDLYGFGTSWENVCANAAAIREECAHVDDSEFFTGRRAFLRTLLSRPRLYYEFTFLEGPARENIEREVHEIDEALAEFAERGEP